MGPRRGQQRPQEDLSNLHPFYQFLSTISHDVLRTYNNRLGWLHNQDFVVSQIIDSAKLNNIGILERLNQYLTKLYVGTGVHMNWNKWRNLFSIKESVYKELCVELFATVGFEKNTKDPQYEKSLVFRLGREYPKCSLENGII